MRSQTAERLRRLSHAAKESTRVAEGDRAARDRAIEEADAEGWGLVEIARAVEMSTSHVQRIVVKTTARRQHADQPETD
jgi:Mor family transcriptional regulator